MLRKTHGCIDKDEKMNFINNIKYKKDLDSVISYLPDEECSILVTGATGLIGSCIVDCLLYANRKYNRKYSIYIMGRSKSRLKDRFLEEESDKFHYVVQDVQEPIDENLKIDYIINAASNADPRTYALYPAETILTNVLGTKNVLEYARKHKNTKVLLTSTMEVYGETGNGRIHKETDYGMVDFNQIRSGYPESKRVAEILCKSYFDEYKVETCIARLGYIYGPTMLKTDNKVVAQFIRKILEQQDIVLKSEGLQRRTYCYVVDAVTGIFTILFKGKSGEAYNVADVNSKVTIREMADIAAEIAGTKVVFELPTELEKKGSSKCQDAMLNTEKLQKLGWSSKYNLREGLMRTVNLLRE